MQVPLSRPLGVEVEPSEPPCGFSAFVAERQGVSLREAERLIESWLATYEPRARRAHSLPTETNDDRDAGRLRICA